MSIDKQFNLAAVLESIKDFSVEQHINMSQKALSGMDRLEHEAKQEISEGELIKGVSLEVKNWSC